MSKSALFMGTTRIPPERTAAEIISCLVQGGARQIGQEYDASQKLIGVKFTIEVLPGNLQCFVLPVKVEPVFKLINGGRKFNRAAYAKDDREQAERVAWRQLLRWVEAQLAMIKLGMVEAGEVFFPYMLRDDGQTLFQLFKEQGMKMLPEKTG